MSHRKKAPPGAIGSAGQNTAREKHGSTPAPPTSANAAGAPATDAHGRLDHKLFTKLKAFRHRKKTDKDCSVDNNAPGLGESQKTTKKTDSKKEKKKKSDKKDATKDCTETTIEDPMNASADPSPFRLKKVEELGKGDIIFGKRISCKINELICVEDHGRVFRAISTRQTEGSPTPPKKEDTYPIAVKTDVATGSMRKWFNTEKEVLLTILVSRPSSATQHFPLIFDSGELANYRYVMMSLHGPNLERMRKEVLKSDFSLSTAVRVAYQILTAIVDLHTIGFYHRDLKPTNFVVGMDTGGDTFLRASNPRTVYMVGFGTCVKKKETNPEKIERKFVNLTFGSRKSHNLHVPMDKNDDLESWLFVAIEVFKRGCLPWRKKTQRSEVMAAKQKFFDEGGFPGMYDFVPEKFKTIVTKCFAEVPEGKNYEAHVIREVFRDIARKHKLMTSTTYDWENNKRPTVDEGPPIEAAKKWKPAKDKTQDTTKTKTTTTSTEDDDKDDKVAQPTDLNDDEEIMLKKVIIDNAQEKSLQDSAVSHSCPTLDPTHSVAALKTAVVEEPNLRVKIPKAIPPDDPICKLTLNKSMKFKREQQKKGIAPIQIMARPVATNKVPAATDTIVVDPAKPGAKEEYQSKYL
uniref:non-specific serine/threonine protein kinase n=1 Tax=Panagrellus redivivus TaxID=6233 RepID=A0A7E4VIS7_PANRE